MGKNSPETIKQRSAPIQRGSTKLRPRIKRGLALHLKCAIKWYRLVVEDHQQSSSGTWSRLLKNTGDAQAVVPKKMAPFTAAKSEHGRNILACQATAGASVNVPRRSSKDLLDIRVADMEDDVNKLRVKFGLGEVQAPVTSRYVTVNNIISKKTRVIPLSRMDTRKYIDVNVFLPPFDPFLPQVCLVTIVHIFLEVRIKS